MKISYKKQMKNIETKFIKTAQITIISTLIALSMTTFALASDITSSNIEYLINKERIYYGLQPLKSDSDLDRAAKLKSKDMINRNYFEHFAYGLTPWDFVKNSGYKYKYAGENLAMNFDTSEGVVKAWMNSPAHRANILSTDFEDIGIGVVKGVYTENKNGFEDTYETTMVTTMYGKKKPVIFDFFNTIIDNFRHLFNF